MPSPLAAQCTKTTAFLVWPTGAAGSQPGEFRGASAELLARLKTIGLCLCGLEFQAVLVDPDRQLLWLPSQSEPSPPAALAGAHPVILLANAGFLVDLSPPVAELVAAALQGRVVVQASRDGRDFCALACPRQALTSAAFLRAVCHLAAGIGDPVDEAWIRKSGVKRLDAGSPSRKHSPAGAGLLCPRGRLGPFAPAVLNTALAEMLDDPADTHPLGRSPQAMRAALLAQREGSAVPWVFNALINHIEYRTGQPDLGSFPPEMHLSLTGACNIECGFCSYAHKKAYFEYVGLAEVQRLDFLRHMHTLRLSSGLGEPTINPHLPAIIAFLAERFPHLALNFFTNGLALNRRGLIDALVHNVTWINVSVNNAERESFQEMCGKDLFGRLCSNLRQLHQAKLARNSIFPVVCGSMVLTTKSVRELPRMPALCRELGVDRLTAFPFASLQTDSRYGQGETLDKCRDQYDSLYAQTVAQAARHQVSLEIPPPLGCKRLRFGLEVRPLYDHARIEENANPVALLVDDLAYEQLPRPNCPQIWQTASVGARFRVHEGTASHFMYPCLGPLCTVDYSKDLAFHFPDAAGFLALWNHPIFAKLRTAQRTLGVSPVCDVCRGCDTRHPDTFATLNTLLAALRPQPVLLPSPQLIGRISR